MIHLRPANRVVIREMFRVHFEGVDQARLPLPQNKTGMPFSKIIHAAFEDFMVSVLRLDPRVKQPPPGDPGLIEYSLLPLFFLDGFGFDFKAQTGGIRFRVCGGG